MKLLPNVLKARSVTIDSENIVTIETNFFVKSEPDINGEFLDEEEKPAPKISNVEDAAAQAAQILGNAERKAGQMLQSAKRQIEEEKTSAEKKTRTEAEALFLQSRKSGYDEGYAEGIKKAEAEGDLIIAESERVLAEAEAEKARMFASAEPEMVALVAQAAEKLLSKHAQTDPQIIFHLIRQGMAGATLTGDVFVHVSAEDYPIAAEHADSIRSAAEGGVNIEIIKDLSLKKTDCIIETPFGNIDCSLGQQFESLKKSLFFISDQNNAG